MMKIVINVNVVDGKYVADGDINGEALASIGEDKLSDLFVGISSIFNEAAEGMKPLEGLVDTIKALLPTKGV